MHEELSHKSSLRICRYAKTRELSQQYYHFEQVSHHFVTSMQYIRKVQNSETLRMKLTHERTLVQLLLLLLSIHS